MNQRETDVLVAKHINAFSLPVVAVVVAVVVVIGVVVVNSVLQLGPDQPNEHTQMKPFSPIKHVPPLAHGFGWHWFVTTEISTCNTLSFVRSYRVERFRIVGQ